MPAVGTNGERTTMGRESNYITVSLTGHESIVRFSGPSRSCFRQFVVDTPRRNGVGFLLCSPPSPNTHRQTPPDRKREDLHAEQTRLDRNTDVRRFNPGLRPAGSGPHRKTANRKPAGPSQRNSSQRHIPDVNRHDFQDPASGGHSHSAKRLSELRASSCKCSGAGRATNVGEKSRRGTEGSTPVR